MLHNGLLNLMNRSTSFGHHNAHHQELATIQMAPACRTSPWLWQDAGLVHGCRLERPVSGMLHDFNNVCNLKFSLIASTLSSLTVMLYASVGPERMKTWVIQLL
jgi:hypothetical protein